MSTVTLIEYPKSYVVIAETHANTTEACAAISMMVTALANWAHDHGDNQSTLLPGKALISIPKTAESRAVYEFTETAFKGLAEIGEITLKKCKSLGKNQKSV